MSPTRFRSLSTTSLPARRSCVRPGQVRPEVSVCIVNWNCRDELRACLRSLLRQPQGVRHEVLVVDNGSRDGAADLVAHEFPEVILIRNALNVGFARANNQAARMSRGRHLFFLNNDTVVPRGTLRKLRDVARQNPAAGLIGPRLVDGRGRAQLSARGFPTVRALLHRLSWLRWTGLFRSAYRRYRGRNGSTEVSRAVEVLMGAALFVPRQVWRECGPWDDSYLFGGEDIDLCARIGARHPVLYHPAIAVTHLGRVSSRRNPGHAHLQTVIGITRQLRARGASRLGLLVYKTAFTIDAPVQMIAKAFQGAWRHLQGRYSKAQKSHRAAGTWAYFLRHGLKAFWRA